MEAVVALAILIVILQISLSLFQMKYYEKFLRELVKKYAKSEGYELDTSISKGIFNTAIVAVVSDESHKIIEAYEYKGKTLFSKFKKKTSIINKTIDQDLIQDITLLGDSLSNKALLKLFNKKLNGAS